jgi:hypothetical protein
MLNLTTEQRGRHQCERRPVNGSSIPGSFPRGSISGNGHNFVLSVKGGHYPSVTLPLFLIEIAKDESEWEHT